MLYFLLVAFLTQLSHASLHQDNGVIPSVQCINPPLPPLPEKLFNSILDCEHILGHPSLQSHDPNVIASLLERDRIEYLSPTPLPLSAPRVNEQFLAHLGRSILPEHYASCQDIPLLAYLTSHLIQYLPQETITSIPDEVVAEMLSLVTEMPCTSFTSFPPSWFSSDFNNIEDENSFDSDSMIESFAENALWSFAFLTELSFRTIFDVESNSNCHLISSNSLKYLSRHQLSLISPLCMKDLSNLETADLSKVIPFLRDDVFSLYSGNLSPPSIKSLSVAQIRFLSSNPGNISLEYFSPLQMSHVPSTLLIAYLSNPNKMRKLSSLWKNVPSNAFDGYERAMEDADFKIYPTDYQFIPPKLLVLILTNSRFLRNVPSAAEGIVFDFSYQNGLPINGEQWTALSEERPDIGGSILALIDSSVDDDLLATANRTLIDSLSMIEIVGLRDDLQGLKGFDCIFLLSERTNYHQVVNKLSSQIELCDVHACDSIDIQKYTKMPWLRSVGGGSKLCKKIILESSSSSHSSIEMSLDLLKKNFPEFVDSSFTAPVKYWSENMTAGLMAYVSVFHLEAFRGWVTVDSLKKWTQEDPMILYWISAPMVRDRHVHFTNDMVPYLSPLAFSLFSHGDWDKFGSENNGYGLISIVIRQDNRLKLQYLLPAQIRLLGSRSMEKINIWSNFPERYFWRLSVEQRSSVQDWQLSLLKGILPSTSLWNKNRLLISRTLFNEWLTFFKRYTDLSAIVQSGSSTRGVVALNEANKDIRGGLFYLVKTSFEESGLSHLLYNRFVRSGDISYLLTRCLGFNLKEKEAKIIGMFGDDHHGWFDLQFDAVERLITYFKVHGFAEVFSIYSKSVIREDKEIFYGYWKLGDQHEFEGEIVVAAAVDSVEDEHEEEEEENQRESSLASCDESAENSKENLKEDSGTSSEQEQEEEK